MAKSSQKQKKMSAKKHKRTSTPKRRSHQIEKSKQLLLKSSTSKTTNRATSCINKKQKMCGNGKPMPSLADLEKMFEESDDENEQTNPGNPESRLTTNDIELSGSRLTPKSCVQSEKLTLECSPQSIIDLTPTALRKIGNDLISFISDSVAKTKTISVESTENYLPTTKHKVPSKRTNACISKICIDCDSDSSDEVLDIRHKKKAKIQNNNYVKCFNNVPNNSHHLEKNPTNPNGDSGSDVILIPDAKKIEPERFSPLPSTSRDDETILKNERNFNATLETIKNVENSKQVENTQFVENTQQVITTKHVTYTKDVETFVPPLEIITISDDIIPDNVTRQNKGIENKRNRTPSPIYIDDEYSSISAPIISETIDICDLSIEDVIAENNVILNKYSSSNSLGRVTEVSPIHTNSANPISSANVIDARNQDILVTQPTPVILLDHNSPVRNYAKKVTKNREPECTYNTSSRTDKSVCNLNENETSMECDNINQNEKADQGSRIMSTDEYLNGLQQLQTYNVKISDKDVSSLNKFLPSDGAKRLLNLIIPKSTMVSIIKEIDTKKTQDTSSDQQTETVKLNFGNCPICMESLTCKTTVSTLCGHIFCTVCLKESLKITKRCPICRKYLKKNGYHPLFLN